MWWRWLGDGALTGGLAYEGLSNAGRSRDRLIVVLNDNRMSISRNVGFVARHLATLRSRPRYVRFKNRFGKVMSHIPLVGPGTVHPAAGGKNQAEKHGVSQQHPV